MPTMGKSPKATARLIEINPDEVSAIDMPANGEPHFVVKGLRSGYDPKINSTKNYGGQMTTPIQKLDESVVPRPVMKAIKTRVERAIESVGELQSLAKNLKTADDGETQKAPSFLADMAKSVSMEIRSLLPDAEVPVYKRGQALAVMSLHAITKQVEDVEKANAVSYLMRDQYVSVTQNVTEYLTTYVDGIETDDDGPILIPVALEETVDKSANELDGLVEEFPSDGGTQADPEPAPQTETTQKASNVMQVGVDFAGEFAKLNKSIVAIGKSVANVVASSQKETDMSQENENTEVVDDVQQTTEEETSEEETSEEETSEEETSEEETSEENTGEETTDESEVAPVAKSDNPILQALAAMETRINKRLDKIEGEVDEVRGVAKAADKKVEKATKRRADSKGGGNDSTTKVETTKGKDDPASFKGVLGLSGL